MKNRYWKQNDKGAQCLYFNAYSDKEFALAMDKNKFIDKNWIFVSDLLKVELDDFEADDLEEAKEIAEDKVLEYFQDKIYHYEAMVEKWEDE